MLFLPPPALPLAAGRQRTDNTVTKRPATGAATIERCCKRAQVNRSRYLIEAGYSPAKRLMIISAHTAHLRIVRAIGEANPGKARHAMVPTLRTSGSSWKIRAGSTTSSSPAARGCGGHRSRASNDPTNARARCAWRQQSCPHRAVRSGDGSSGQVF